MLNWSVTELSRLGDSFGEGGVDLALDGQNQPRIAVHMPAPTNELAYARIAFEVQRRQGGGQCAAGVVARMSRLAVFPKP